MLVNFLKMWPHCATEVGELDPGDRADKKPAAKLFFKSLNCCAQRWLRDVASLGCSGEAQLFAHSKKVFDLVYFH